ncbi:MAG TPA: translocation/assembly module TamB domain-containing protein, partial [Kofleriaceae bacterium]|nr:translocation/assembly module TamB domain-containing protein [Kofleriaceae bacterium]
GNPAAAAAELGLALPIRALPRQLDVTVSARGALRGDIAVALQPTRVQLAGGAVAVSGRATLTDRKLAAASATIRLDELDLAGLARLAGRPSKVTGSLGGSIDLTRAGARTDVAVDLTALLDRPALAVRVRGAADPRSAVALRLDASRRSDGAVLATADARLPITTRGGKRTLARGGDWRLVVDVGQRSLADIAALLPERVRGKIPAGAVAAHIDIGGTPARPSGSAHIDLSGAFLKGRPLEQQIRVDAAIGPGPGGGIEIATDGSIKLDDRRDPTALIRGGIGLQSLDRASLRRAEIDLALEIPRRALASYAGLRPALARLPGQVGGGATLRGPVGALQIDSRLAWTGYRTADGGAGETALVIRGTPRDLTATATMSGGVSIAADIHRGADGTIAIATRARADHVPLARVLPELVARRVAQPGHLRWHMDADIALARRGGTLAAVKKALAGTLQVDDAVLALPGSSRRFERIGLDLAADPGGLTIRSLSIHERDVEVADRRLDLRGAVAWDELKPTRVALDVTSRDWLLFGTPLLGPSDAPRAAADLDLGLAIDLTAPVMKVDATVRRLDLRSPDRADRGHQPEDIAPGGDVIFTGGETVAGKLPVPPRASPAAAAPPRRRRPMDITVRIPRLVRLNQTPFDLRARGTIRIAVREDGTRVRGGLAIPQGSLYLFGKTHRLASGKLTFSDEHPKGWIELVFRRRLSPAAGRDLAGSDEMQVTFAGPPTAPRPKLGGAGNAALAEAMAMNSSGHPLHLSEPDMPASATVQAPRGDQLQVLSFMASNMPHLLFLDRFSAWADPTEGRAAYGRVEHFEGERTSASGRTRVRVVTRPPTPGRSSAEVHWDRLLMDRRRSAFGVGLRGGSRAGGGVGFFFEWSSDD